MGLFMSDGPLSLRPVHPPVGINMAFTNHPLVTLVLKEKVFSLTGDDFTVTDQQGYPVVRCSGKVMSLRQRKEIKDPSGNHLFSLKEKILSIHTTFYGEDSKGREVFEIKKPIFGFGAKLAVTFTNASTGKPCTLLLKGDIFGRTADIVMENGPPVAQIKRKSINIRNLMFGQDTYFVDVAPGVDLSLIAAVCMCLDEIKSDN